MESSQIESDMRSILSVCAADTDHDVQVATALSLCGLGDREIAARMIVPVEVVAAWLEDGRALSLTMRLPTAEGTDRAILVLYLLFTNGCALLSWRGDAQCSRAIELARCLRRTVEQPHAELDALLALFLLANARRTTRIDDAGDIQTLAEQDRSRWDREQIAEARSLLDAISISAPSPSPIVIQAHIAALHAEAGEFSATDWRSIIHLYDRLLQIAPSAVVALNRAVAISMFAGPAAALPILESLEPALASYVPWYATMGNVMERLDRLDETVKYYEIARSLSSDILECRFFDRRLELLRARRLRTCANPTP